MHLDHFPLKFSRITHHASVTQCLGSIGGNVWYLGVAKPSVVDSNEIKDDSEKTIVKSSGGHFYVPPAVEDVQVFKISGPKFIKLHRGTWHAGPLFKPSTMDFYNLELANTNVSFPFPFQWNVTSYLHLNSFEMLFRIRHGNFIYLILSFFMVYICFFILCTGE